MIIDDPGVWVPCDLIGVLDGRHSVVAARRAESVSLLFPTSVAPSEIDRIPRSPCTLNRRKIRNGEAILFYPTASSIQSVRCYKRVYSWKNDASRKWVTAYRSLGNPKNLRIIVTGRTSTSFYFFRIESSVSTLPDVISVQRKHRSRSLEIFPIAQGR